jgi:hypothetical protein
MRPRRWVAIIAVALLLGLLLPSLIGPSYWGSNFDVPENWATHTMIQLSLAILDYHDEHGRVPARLDDLLGSPRTHETALLDALLDPWGRPYHYRALPGVLTFELRSGGPDKTLWTADDIVND